MSGASHPHAFPPMQVNHNSHALDIPPVAETVNSSRLLHLCTSALRRSARPQ